MTLESIDQKYNVAETELYKANQFYDLLRDVESVCTIEDIQSAKSYADIFITKFSRSYAILPTHEQLDISIKMFEKLRKTHPRLLALPPQYKCILKYVVLAVQDWLRTYHMDTMTSSGLIDDFELGSLTSFEGKVNGFTSKVELFDAHIEDLKRYEEALGIPLSFTYTNKEGFSSELSDERSTLAMKSDDLMRGTIYKSLVTLINSGFLTKQDVEELNGKIDLTFENSCNHFHGNYRVRETKDDNGNQVDLEVVGMPLSINVCGNYFLLRDIAHKFEKIVTHELGHHYYYFSDDARDSFTSICRDNEVSRNRDCEDSDFVSDYSTSSSLEDYAETFMYSHLGIREGTSPIIEQKKSHFVK